MSELELARAFDEAARVLWEQMDLWAQAQGDKPVAWADADSESAADCNELARKIVDAAAPIIERQVREKVAREIEAHVVHYDWTPPAGSSPESVALFHAKRQFAAIARGGVAQDRQDNPPGNRDAAMDDTPANQPHERTGMSKYRKKPVVIEAMQWDPSTPDCGRVVGWLMGTGCDFYHPSGSGETTTLAIRTLEGEMLAQPGDWIIQGVAGEFYPCRDDIFQVTYEAA